MADPRLPRTLVGVKRQPLRDFGFLTGMPSSAYCERKRCNCLKTSQAHRIYMKCFLGLLLVLAAHSLTAVAGPAAAPPVIPVGLDAYQQWDRWPAQRIGARAYMRSTYDRRGGNEGADASHFLYQRADDYNVTLDVAGPGTRHDSGVGIRCAAGAGIGRGRGGKIQAHNNITSIE